MGTSLGPRVTRHWKVYPDPKALSRAFARHLLRSAREAVRARGRFTWVLAGGRTPRSVYRHLAHRYREEFPWPATELFFGDERCVPPEEPTSNYGMTREALLAHVAVRASRVHRLEGELRPPRRAAERYARIIGPVPASSPRARPRFDLVLLGVGPDGHTASLFPSSSALRERRRTVVAVRRPTEPPFVPRLTMTLPALSSSRELCFLVSGPEKAAVVASVLSSPPPGDPALPASLLKSAGPVHWFLDRAAAKGIPPRLADPPSRVED